MLFKLAFKNIRKSIKDYSIYFFTLLVAVSIFYIFNSMDAQTTMVKLNESKYDIMQSMVVLLGYVSIFVSIVLGFLIIYSNNFLIKRRKKEIGLYLTLGMSKRKVSTILVVETLIVGIISLAVGLLLGVGLSQLLSIVVAKLFEADLSGFKFIFSSQAFFKTILYFGIIFVLVMIFNVISLSKYKLIDLLTANHKNEKLKFRNKWVTIISFILAVSFIGYAYKLLFDHALYMMDYKTILMLVFGSLGTFLLFFSLSGFLLTLIKKSKKLYNKGLNMFIFNQVNSRINTTVISTTFICLMLLLTVGILSSCLSLTSVFNSDINDNNLTDFTISIHDESKYIDSDIGVDEDFITSMDLISEFAKSEEVNKIVNKAALVHYYFDKDFITKDMMTKGDIKTLQDKYGAALSLNFNVPMIKESEYKKLMEVEGIKPIDLKDNQYLLLANIDFIENAYDDYYESGKGITINGHKLIPASDKIIEVAVQNYNTSGNDGILVVSDDVVVGLDLLQASYSGLYNEGADPIKMDKELEDYALKVFTHGFNISTRESMKNSTVGIKAIAVFIGLYLGIIFAISSATILAIGELSSSSDNKERYKVLKQLGADNKMINKSIFLQILIIFLFPLIIALVHSYFGLKEINLLIISLGNIDLSSNIILTTLFMLIVYGGYFLLTYICSKSIIKDNN